MTQPPEAGPLLAIDSGSPLVSVAVGTPDALLATSAAPSIRSSAAIMGLIDSCLATADLGPESLAGIIVLAGPGSFTGLRVGMSIGLGMHQALGTPAGALSTFRALAAAAPDRAGPVLAVVRALRSEWYAQRFESADQPAAPPERLSDWEIPESAPQQVLGFSLDSIHRSDASSGSTRWIEPGPLAPIVLTLGEHVEWGPTALTSPAYLAPPPVRRPAP
jgi:tRNA threonylcarbamoyladenosine biosynthesis protein TsaB